MISHKHRFIFVHISRTSGCRFEAIFGIDFDPFINPDQPDDRRHTKLGEYRSRFPDLFPAYFKFAFVRNPWERIVSRYCQHQDKLARKFAELDTAVAAAQKIKDAVKWDQRLTRLAEKRAATQANPYRASFQEWIVNHARMNNQLHEGGIDMEPHFDFVGRFERLHLDYQTVFERIGIDVELPHMNKSRHDHYTSYYDDRSRAIVAERCAHDIARFGYRFGE